MRETLRKSDITDEGGNFISFVSRKDGKKSHGAIQFKNAYGVTEELYFKDSFVSACVCTIKNYKSITLKIPYAIADFLLFTRAVAL